jgi:membrane-bound serine protease (ClpP class)
MVPFIVLILGLVLIFFEFFLPGWILGILGGMAVLASIVLFGIEYPSPLLIFLYVTGIFVSLFYVIKYALWQIQHSSPRRSIYLQGDQEGYVASTFDRDAIGKTGIVDTDLKPGGHVMIEGKRHLAISQSGYISKGEQVIVVGGEGESLTVKQLRKANHHE